MKIIFYNHRTIPDYVKQIDLKELYGQSDILSLHVPQTPQTTEMINIATGVIVINTAQAVYEYDLAQAIATYKILTAGIDLTK